MCHRITLSAHSMSLRVLIGQYKTKTDSQPVFIIHIDPRSSDVNILYLRNTVAMLVEH